ncbi:MAG: SDR family NAD(P)-dependent oxidoreductase, partial [Candidatus Dormibacteraeota bacterium]|nr:SDR family NAD(P)-dependent oxidoreductase [Candidatus Dormibacteraeota bacterium]
MTGGASGIGAAVARRLHAAGDGVVIADIDGERGTALALELGAMFTSCDVRSLVAVRETFAAAAHRFGGIDIAFLNAGVGEHGPLDERFDEQLYRRSIAVNVDGVVHGVVASLPLLRTRGGGDIIVTASLAGLTPFPLDPVYTATKHAMVGLVRAMAPSCAADGVRINALCPGFADTPIINPIREVLAGGGMPLLAADDIADAFMDVIASGDTGQCWFVQPGRRSEPY